MKKLLGIDLGTTKTGLARSDESGTLAFAWKTIEGNLPQQLLKLTEIIFAENYATIVFGLPSQKGEWKDKIQAFAKELKASLKSNGVEIPITFANEDYSSFDAQQNIREVKSTMKMKKRLQTDHTADDAEAARIMLQEHLDNNSSL